MKKKIVILSILFAVVLTNCTNISNDLENEYWTYTLEKHNLGGYITYAANFPNSDRLDSCIIYIDSLVNINRSIALTCGYYLDSVENKVLLSFMDLNDCDYWIKKRNIYLISVIDSGLYHNGEPLTKEKFYKTLYDYQKNHYEREDYPQSKESYNKYFGFELVSKVRVVIETEKTAIEPYKSIDWDQYLETIQLVKDSYFRIWNEKAQLVWNKNFEELEYDKQEAIMKTAIIGMELNFIKRRFYRE